VKERIESALLAMLSFLLRRGPHTAREISAILDQHGIANDFNSFVSYVS